MARNWYGKVDGLKWLGWVFKQSFGEGHSSTEKMCDLIVCVGRNLEIPFKILREHGVHFISGCLGNPGCPDGHSIFIEGKDINIK